MYTHLTEKTNTWYLENDKTDLCQLFVVGVLEMPFCCIWGSLNCHFVVSGGLENAIFMYVGVSKKHIFVSRGLEN